MTRSLLYLLAACTVGSALERPGLEFKVFQFPADRIPRMDGKTDDWDLVPDLHDFVRDVQAAFAGLQEAAAAVAPPPRLKPVAARKIPEKHKAPRRRATRSRAG